MKFWEIFFDKKNVSLFFLRVFLCAHIIIIRRAQTRRESYKIRFAFDDDDRRRRAWKEGTLMEQQTTTTRDRDFVTWGGRYFLVLQQHVSSSFQSFLFLSFESFSLRVVRVRLCLFSAHHGVLISLSPPFLFLFLLPSGVVFVVVVVVVFLSLSRARFRFCCVAVVCFLQHVFLVRDGRRDGAAVYPADHRR